MGQATSSPNVVVRTPPQSDGAAIQSHDSRSDEAKPDEVRPIPPSTAADAAESLKFGTTTLLHPAAIIQCMDSGCTVKPTAKPDEVRPIPPSTAADAAEPLKFGLTTLLHPAAIMPCLDSRCTLKPTAKPDMTSPPTNESLSTKFETTSLLQKPDGAGIQFGDLGCSYSKSDKVLRTPPYAVNFVESLSMKLEQKLAGWDDNTRFDTPPSTVNAVEHDSTILEQKLDGAGIQGSSTGRGWDAGQLQPTGWDGRAESERVLLPPPSTVNHVESLGMKALEQKLDVDGIRLGETPWDMNPTWWGVEVKPTGWEDEEIPMTNKDGNSEEGKYPTWFGVEVKPTGWEDEEISKKAVPMTNKEGSGEGVKYPTWWGVEVKPTGWEDNEEISEKAVPMTNKDGNSEGVKYPTWCGVEVKPTGWEDEEISEKAVPMTNKDGNSEGVKYPTWCGVEVKPTGWEDGERSDKAVPKPNKDGSFEGVKYPERSAVKFPERPGQPDCSFYVNSGICKFGLSCKFNHPALRKTRTKAKPKKPPEPIQTGIYKVPMALNTEEPVLGMSTPFQLPPAVAAAAETCPQSKILKEEKLEGKSHRDRYHGPISEGKSNSEESISSKEGKSETDFLQRPDKPDCSYYLNTGNCQFGSNCRFNHPSRRKGNKKDGKEHIKDAPMGKTGNPESKADKGKQSKTLPGRTGQTERKINKRQYSVPGGDKFRTASKHAYFPGKTEPGPVKLNFLGLPMRPGQTICTDYMHTGVCKFATNCRFHHPNPTPVTAEDTLSAFQNAASPQQHVSGEASALPTTSWTLPNASHGPLPYPSPPYTPGFYPLPPQGVYPHPGWSGYQVPSLPPEMVSGNSSTSKMSSGHGQTVCHSFVKTGYCKYGFSCRNHHPKDSPESTDGSESTRS